jgi:hypothetical protein
VLLNGGTKTVCTTVTSAALSCQKGGINFLLFVLIDTFSLVLPNLHKEATKLFQSPFTGLLLCVVCGTGLK